MQDLNEGETDLLSVARRLRPLLEGCKQQSDARCVLEKRVVDAMRQASFFRILQPTSFGGLAMSPEVLFKVEIILAEGDMSASWVMANMAVAAFHASLFDQAAQFDLWGKSPESLVAFASMAGGSLKRLSSDEFELTGRWRFSSGINHADWVILGSNASTGDDEIAGACLVPKSDFVVHDDWDVAGLRGTGSHAVVVDGARVPSYRFLPHIQRFDGSAPGRRVNTAAVFSIPLPQLLFRSISSASIGGLRGMLDSFVADNLTRVSMLSQKIACDPNVHSLCGRVKADLQAFEDGIAFDVRLMLQGKSVGDELDLARRRIMRLNATRVADKCFILAAELFRAAGTQALYNGSPLLAYLNDMLVARHHAANQYEVHARNDGALAFGEFKEDILL